MTTEGDCRRTIHHLKDNGYSLKQLLKYLKIIIEEEKDENEHIDADFEMGRTSEPDGYWERREEE